MVAARALVGLGLFAAALVQEDVDAEERGYVFWLTISASGRSELLYASAHGSWHTTLAAAGSRRNAWAYLTPPPGNRAVLAVEDGSVFGTFLYEANTGAYTPVPIPLFPSGRSGVRAITFDQGGDLIALPGENTSGDGLYRLGTNLAWTRIGSLPSGPISGIQTVLVDLDTADFIVAVSGTGVMRIRRSGVTTTITSSPVMPTAQDPETGDFLFWDSASDTVRRLDGAGRITPTGVGWPLAGYDKWVAAVTDQPSALGEFVIVAGSNFGGVSSRIGRVSRLGGSVTTVFGWPAYITDLMMDRTMNVSTTSAGSSRWNVLVDFPYDAGFPYVCLVGASGYRPGMMLADGRRIRLNPDPVTWSALSGLLPGATGLVGVLDSRGTARGMIDVSALGPRARGTLFWLVGVVLDPAAPHGVRGISPPIVVQIP